MTELEDLTRLIGVAADSCQSATGRRLERPDFSAWPTSVRGEESFRRLVSGAYVWLRELWPAHLNFFRSSAAAAVGLPYREMREGGRDVHVLRTSQQHRLNPDDPRDAKTLHDVAQWMRAACGSSPPQSGDEWQRCGEELLAVLERLLREFIAVARAIEADADLSDKWRQCFAAEDLDLVAVREEIAADLGLHLRPGDAAFLDRRVKQSWDRMASRSASTRSAELARATVLRELVGWSTPELPFDLDALLDQLNIDPGRKALGAVRLAHAASEILEFDSTDDLLEIIAELWRSLQDKGRS